MEPELIMVPKRKRKTAEFSVGKRRIVAPLSDAEKERLEKLVLGDASYMLRNLGMGDSDSGVEDGYMSDTSTRNPAWEDDDDQGIRVDDDLMSKEKRRRKTFADTYGQPSWAKLSKEAPDEVDEDMAVIRTAGNFIRKPTYLPKGVLGLKRLASLNSETRNEGPVVKCVEFHPTSTVALVAGLSGAASIFQVDGTRNNKLASVHFERFPIKCAHFTSDGSAFLVGSQHHSFFYVYDMMEGTTIKIPTHHNMQQTNFKHFEMSPDGRLMAVIGRFGQVNLLSATSKEWITTLSHNSNVTSIAFSPDGAYLYSHTETGEVYVWEMESRRMVTKFADEGALVARAMAVSDDYLATGSSWGVVNLYERPDRSSSQPKPIKVFNNLVTSITALKFNPTQQILAMASDDKDDQVKMAHLPSMTVFSNFPTVNSNLHRVQAFDFSPASGYFALSNSYSSAFLYRLSHFTSY